MLQASGFQDSYLCSIFCLWLLQKLLRRDRWFVMECHDLRAKSWWNVMTVCPLWAWVAERTGTHKSCEFRSEFPKTAQMNVFCRGQKPGNELQPWGPIQFKNTAEVVSLGKFKPNRHQRAGLPPCCLRCPPCSFSWCYLFCLKQNSFSIELESMVQVCHNFVNRYLWR